MFTTKGTASLCRLARFLAPLAFVFALSALAPAQSPTAWWKFQDGHGTTAVDSSGNGYNATLVNGVDWVTGHNGGYAVSALAPSRQYISAPPINLSNTRSVTVAIWVKRTYSTNGGHTLFEATNNFNNYTTGFALFPDSSTCDGIEADLKGNVGYVANCYNQPSSGVWHHLAVVYDKTQTGGNEVKLYIDAVLQPVNWSIYAYTNTNYFGNNPIYTYSRGGSSEFNSGMVDDMRVYNTALTAAQIQQIYLGTGDPGTLTPTPASLIFGSVYVGNYSTLPVTLQNTGSAPVTVSAVALAGSEFSLSPIQTPFTLQPQGTAQLNVTFTPTVAGSASGTVTVTSNATNSPLAIPLSGTGVTQGGSHSVSLSWTASISPGIAGYNVYRSTTSGGPYTLLTSSLDTLTTYTDQTVQGGTTYYYVTTAVNSQGLESGDSNQVSATVP